MGCATESQRTIIIAVKNAKRIANNTTAAKAAVELSAEVTVAAQAAVTAEKETSTDEEAAAVEAA